MKFLVFLGKTSRSGLKAMNSKRKMPLVVFVNGLLFSSFYWSTFPWTGKELVFRSDTDFPQAQNVD